MTPTETFEEKGFDDISEATRRELSREQSTGDLISDLPTDQDGLTGDGGGCA